jgi:serine/threonine protein kinase
MTRRLPSAPPLLPGLDYVRPLGSGGFADVFLYQQDMPRRAVAVKVLPAGERDPDLLRMFNAEADVLAHLSAHPAIVTVYQAGISADGRPYIVMEYCPGSLAQRYRIERMPVDEVMAVAVRLAGALESAHRAGLIHRDIKPSNILVTTFGSAVLADFGISASLQRSGIRRPGDVDPVERAGSRRRAHRRHDRERGVEPGRDRVLAAGRAQPVRAAREGSEHPRADASPHRPGDLRADRPPGCARRAAAGARDGDDPRPRPPLRLGAEFGEAVREVQRAAGSRPHRWRCRRRSGCRHPTRSTSPTCRRAGRRAAASRRASARDGGGHGATHPSADEDATGLSASAPRALWSPRVIALSIVGALVVGGGLLAAGAALWTVIR